MESDNDEAGRLRVYTSGGSEVAFAAGFLSDLDSAYNSLLAFEAAVSSAERMAEYEINPFLFELWNAFPRPRSRQFRAFSSNGTWPPSRHDLASAVPFSDRIILSSAEFASPGFWEFLGRLNPIEVIRQYLNDRHERRKDRQYREAAEDRRLHLENLQRENHVLKERIEIAQNLGATKRDLAPLVNELVRKPLERLDEYQDKGLISTAAITEGHKNPGGGTDAEQRN